MSEEPDDRWLGGPAGPGQTFEAITIDDPCPAPAPPPAAAPAEETSSGGERSTATGASCCYAMAEAEALGFVEMDPEGVRRLILGDPSKTSGRITATFCFRCGAKL